MYAGYRRRLREKLAMLSRASSVEICRILLCGSTNIRTAPSQKNLSAVSGSEATCSSKFLRPTLPMPWQISTRIRKEHCSRVYLWVNLPLDAGTRLDFGNVKNVARWKASAHSPILIFESVHMVQRLASSKKSKCVN
jgi:hypothetical protein